MFVIEKKIPIPDKRAKYPLAEMKVGDSFLADRSAQASIHTSARNVGVKVTSRKEGDKLRVWRTA